MPVNTESLSEDDVARIRMVGTSRELDYDRARHVSHYKACVDPEQFSLGKKDESKPAPPKKQPEQGALFNPPKMRTWD
jgi:hypothetical protein